MIYFDNAATSWPKPRAVEGAVKRLFREPYGNPGRGGHAAAMRAAETVYRARVKAAELFGAKGPHLVCFTGGCTESLNAAISGAVRYGMKVMTGTTEHNSVIRPLIRAGADISYFDSLSDEETILGQIRAGLLSGVSAVVCAWASNVFPTVLPIRRIGALCREHGAVFIVDAAQAAGIYDINVDADNIDILCAPAHKGLYGVTGCGITVFSEGYDVRSHPPLTVGGSGADPYPAYMPDRLPERFEAGTLPLLPIAALSAGIDFVRSTGIAAIRAHEESISAAILDSLSGVSGVTFYRPSYGPLLCFNIDGKAPEETAALLDSRGICARAGMHCAPGAHKYTAPDGSGAVRISFSVFNTEEEAEYFCDVIKDIIRL